jgi:hypothetical protein
VRAWGQRAAAALAGLQAHLEASPPAPPPLAVRTLLLLAPLACYAPWTHPALAAGAGACLAALGTGSGDGTGRALVGAHAGALLEWARSASAGGAWRAPAAAGVRHVIPWLLARLGPAALQGQGLALALPLALRLCDDWEATSVWCGLSALAALLAAATPTALAPWGPLVHEALARAAACSAVGKHPTLAIVLAHTRGYALAVLVGPCPAPSLAALSRACARRGGGGGSASSLGSSAAVWGDSSSSGGGGAPLFEGPWDAALAALLVEAGRTPSAHILYALLHALPPYLLGAGALGLARLMEHLLLPLLQRAACPEQMMAAGGEQGEAAAAAAAEAPLAVLDARLPAAALHALRVLVGVLSCSAPPHGPSAAAAAAGAAPASAPLPPRTLATLLSICLGAAACIARSGVQGAALVWPEAQGGEEEGGAEAPPALPLEATAAQVAAARGALGAQAAALLAALRQAWPSAVEGALAAVRGRDAALDAALLALPPQGGA